MVLLRLWLLGTPFVIPHVGLLVAGSRTMHKKALFILALAVFIVPFFVPVPVQAQTLSYGQSFQLLNLGPIVGQDLWELDASVGPDPTVVASTSCFAGRCLQFREGSDVVSRPFLDANYSSLFYQLRLDGGINGSYDTILSWFGTTTSAYATINLLGQAAGTYCVRLSSTQTAYETVQCGLDLGDTYLINVVADLREYPTVCRFGVSIDNQTPVFYSSTSCAGIPGVINTLVYRLQTGGAEKWASIDNIIVSSNPLFVAFSTTTAPFSSTNLDEYCGEIATSTNFVDQIGSSFSNGLCRTFAYFFIPNTNSLTQFTSLQGTLSTKIPFSYFYDISSIVQTISATSTTSSDFYTIGFYANDIINSSSTPLSGGNLLPNVFIGLSTTTIATYYPDSIRTTTRDLIAVLLWVTFGGWLFFRALDVITAGGKIPMYQKRFPEDF